MPYYILQKGNNPKNRYAIKAVSITDARKNVVQHCGMFAWKYVNKTDTAADASRSGAVIVGE